MFEFKMTEEQELLLEELDKFFENGNYGDYFRECDKKGEYPRKAADDYMEAGFHSLGIPEEFGGQGMDIITCLLVEINAYAHGWPGLTLPGGGLCIDVMQAYGSAEQLKIVSDFACERGLGAYTLGFSEPQAGSDNSAMTTKAVHKDGMVHITGNKTFNTGANVSPYMLCIAREYENENPYQDMSWYLVPMDSEGITIKPIDKIGCHCMQTCEVYLDDVVVPETALIGKKGMGFYQLMKNFEIERIYTCASNVGFAICAYNEAVKYAGSRKQFGQKIGTYQIIQQKITDMKIKIDNMMSMILKCAAAKEAGESLGAEASLLKRYTGMASFEVIDDAMQIMGGIGYTEDCCIARLWRDQRGCRIYAGTEEIMVHSSARELIKRGKYTY